MPSLCWPRTFEPKPAITRPRTGQRNAGAPALAVAPASAVAVEVAEGPDTARFAAGAGVASVTLGADAAACTFGACTFGAAGAGTARDAVMRPGMMMRSP